MMNYELFKEVVTEKFMDYMSEEFVDFKVDIHPVVKVNQTLDSINLIPTDDSEWKVAPTIYINTMYDHYKQCENLQEVIKSAADSMIQAFEEAPEMTPLLQFETAKENIVMVLINTEQNKEMLKNIPHREFQDLSIIYRWVVEKGRDGISSTILNNGLKEKLGMSEETLFKAAVENTKRIFPPTIKSMNEVILDMMKSDGMPGEIAQMMVDDMPKDQMMYVISNNRGINGAASMLYENELHSLAEKLENDLYIMPSSIHEVIAVSVNMGDPNELAQMVNEINIDQVALDERLSNQVYHYDKDLRKLTLATDTPNKRLDGVVAEANLIYEAKDQSR